MKRHALLGRIINSIDIAEDKKALRFNTSEGDVIARAYGDCFSETWIEHLELTFMGFPARVESIYDLEMPDLGPPDGGDVIAYYGLKIKTDKGDIILDYRNLSNGYYGGSLVFDEDDWYAGVFGQNESNMKWRPVTADKGMVKMGEVK